MPLYVYHGEKYRSAGSSYTRLDGHEQRWRYEGTESEVFSAKDDEAARVKTQQLREKIHADRFDGILYRCEPV